MSGWSSPWALATVALLGAALLADAALGKRYARGDGARDGGTARALVVSLNFNLLALFALPALGVAQLPAALAAPLAPVGFAFALAGVALRYAAIFTLGELFTWRVAILDGHAIVDRGVFGVLRHPSYAGGIAAMLGAALAFGSWGALALFTATHVPLLLRRIRLEERALLAHFGDAYRAYMERTARLLPHVW